MWGVYIGITENEVDIAPDTVRVAYYDRTGCSLPDLANRIEPSAVWEIQIKQYNAIFFIAQLVHRCRYPTSLREYREALPK